MREIKFRLWDKTNRKMYQSHVDQHSWYFDDEYDSIQFPMEIGGHLSYKDKNKAVLLQYTGLKDKNGKEIYEGDIVKYTFRDGGRFNTRYMEITYRDAGFKMIEIYRDYWLEKVDGKLTLKHGYLVDYKGELSNLHPSNLVYWTEVIGNIYENPELLEGE